MKKKIIQGICIAIVIGMIIRHYLLHKNTFLVIQKIEIKNLSMLFASTFLGYITYSINLLLLLKKNGLKNITYFAWLKLFLVSRFINFYITQGANIYRSVKLKRDFEFSYTQSISVITFLSWFFTITTLLWCICAISIVGHNTEIQGLPIISVLIPAELAVSTLPFILNRCFKTGTWKNAFLQKMDRTIHSILESFRHNIKDRPLLFKMTLISMMHFLLYSNLVYFSFQAIGIAISLPSLAIFTVVLMLSKYFNIVPGNLGLTELVCGLLSQSLQNDLSHGIVISGIIRMADYLLIFLLGIVFSKSLISKTDIKNQELC